MILRSHNEWGRLRAAIVGRADNARVPADDVSVRAINYAGGKAREIRHGPYPQQVIDEANEDLEHLCRALVDAGVTVYRPEVPSTDLRHGVAGWTSDGYYAFCPRDGFLVVGETVIEAPMVLRSRYTDAFPYRRIFQKAMLDGARWIAAPKPQLPDESYDEHADRDHKSLRNLEPVFDAANVLRANEDLLFLESNSGNALGAQWLQSALGPAYRVHLLRGIYSYMHLDSTISLLRPGLALLNPQRMRPDNLPPFFDKMARALVSGTGRHRLLPALRARQPVDRHEPPDARRADRDRRALPAAPDPIAGARGIYRDPRAACAMRAPWAAPRTA